MTSTQLPPVPFAVTPRRPGEPEPDLTGFSLAHQGLLAGSRLLADALVAIAAGEPCPRERRDAIAWYARHFLDEVHAHHHKEDDVLWPVIVASAGDAVDHIGLSAEHVELAEVLEQAYAARRRFAAGVQSREFAEVMKVLADELAEHIAEEEDTVFAVIREHVSAADFAHCEKLFQNGAKPAHLLFLMPFFLAHATPEQLAGIGKLPLPVKVMLALGRRRYTKAENLVRG